MFKCIRLKMLLNTILDAKTPREVFELVSGFMGDDTEINGNISHKELMVNYRFLFDKTNEHLQVGLFIQSKHPEPQMSAPVGEGGQPLWNVAPPPLFNFHICVRKDQLPLLQSTIKSFLSLLR